MTDATPTLTVYAVPAENMPGLIYKIAQVSKKSMKLLGKPIVLTVVREERRPTGRKNIAGQQIMDLIYHVTVDAETPRIHGWTFLATIDHSAAAGNVLRVAPNAPVAVPETYRTVGAVCDHCGVTRTRRDTFLLCEDATGKIKQIGRQCIRDFIGYDVAQVVAMAEMVHALSGIGSDVDPDDDGWQGGMRDRKFISVASYLAHTAAMVRAFGWVSKKDLESGKSTGMSTAARAMENMFRRADSRWSREPLVDADFAMADAAMAWGRSLSLLKPRSDYEYNLAVLAHETEIEARSTGIVASLVPAYSRATEQAFKRAEARTQMHLDASQFVGVVGTRVTLNVDAVLYGYHSFEGQFGPTAFLRFLTADGNVIVWAAGGNSLPDGLNQFAATKRQAVHLVAGFVKKHDTYQGVRQTYVNRVKLTIVT